MFNLIGASCNTFDLHSILSGGFTQILLLQYFIGYLASHKLISSQFIEIFSFIMDEISVDPDQLCS